MLSSYVMLGILLVDEMLSSYVGDYISKPIIYIYIHIIGNPSANNQYDSWKVSGRFYFERLSPEEIEGIL